MALVLSLFGLLSWKEPPQYLMLLKPKRVPMISTPPTDHSISFLTNLKVGGRVSRAFGLLLWCWLPAHHPVHWPGQEHVTTVSNSLAFKVDSDIATLQHRHKEALQHITEAKRVSGSAVCLGINGKGRPPAGPV